MGKRIDLRSRVDEATVASTPTMWDPKIARAVVQRREQHAARSPEYPASGTELIQTRLAEARADRKPRPQRPRWGEDIVCDESCRRSFLTRSRSDDRGASLVEFAIEAQDHPKAQAQPGVSISETRGTTR